MGSDTMVVMNGFKLITIIQGNTSVVPAVMNSSCEGLTSGVSPSLVCSPQPYTGDDSCRNYLLTWKNCTQSDVDVPLTVSLSESLQSDADEQVQLFFSLLGKVALCTDLCWFLW